METLAQQFSSLRCAQLSSVPVSDSCPRSQMHKKTRTRPIVSAAPISNAQTKERLKLKELFREANERCRTYPMDGVTFTVEDFHAALDKYDIEFANRTKVKGTVLSTHANGALVEVSANSSAFLPTHEACIHNIRHIQEAGIFPGLQGEFMIIGENEAEDSLILSLRPLQFGLAWERCRQLQEEDAIVKGRVVGGAKGGVVAIVEGLSGFVPSSRMSTKSTPEELLNKEIPLKFVEVDEYHSRLVLSHRKTISDGHTRLGIGSVVTGTVQILKPYGAFIDIGGINGLLHVSQISHEHISDLATVLQPGDSLKVMILSHDPERDRLSLSTKKLEPTPGDMIRNPRLVFERAEEMAQNFCQRIAEAEDMARADMFRLKPK